MIANGAKVDAVNKNGRTPLHLAALRDDEELAEWMIANGAKVDAVDASDRTPLHFAVSRGNQKFAEWMIANGAKVDAVDAAGKTPLLIAVLTGNQKLAEWMIANGAKVDIKDQFGRTLIDIANFYGYKDLVNFLISIPFQNCDITKSDFRQDKVERSNYRDDLPPRESIFYIESLSGSSSAEDISPRSSMSCDTRIREKHRLDIRKLQENSEGRSAAKSLDCSITVPPGFSNARSRYISSPISRHGSFYKFIPSVVMASQSLIPSIRPKISSAR